MARVSSIYHLIPLILLPRTGLTRPVQNATTKGSVSMTTSTRTTSTTSAPGVSTTAVVPVHPLSIANSLATQYFPSTTPADFKAVSWPSTVVIGTVKYDLRARETGTYSNGLSDAGQSNSSHTASQSTEMMTEQREDKILSIVIGVVIGVIAVAVMVVAFCFVHRRQKKTGSAFMRRPSTSMGSVRSRGARLERHSSLLSNYNRSPQHCPGVVHHQNSRSTIDEISFYTPQERSTVQLGQYELDSPENGRSELDHHEPAQRRSASSLRDARSSITYSPIITPQTSANSLNPKRSLLHNYTNPLSEVRETDDFVVSPILPSKSPERRYSPIIHYPSLSEVSEFDFAGSVRDRASVESYKYHPARERRDGRHELA